MSTTKTGFFRSLFYSITSFSKYRLFLRHRVGRAVVYLLLLTLLLSIPICFKWYSELKEGADLFMEIMTDVVPDFKFENGKLEVNGEMPIAVDYKTPVVIDTRPDAKDRILNQYDNVILITSDEVIQKNYLNVTSVPLNIYGYMTVTRDDIMQSLPVLEPIFYAIIIIYTVIFAISFVAGKFISALLVSLIGLAVNAVKGTRLSYRNVFKISVYSMTLPLIAGTVLNTLNVHIPFLWVLFYIGCSIYVVGAISYIRYELDALYGSISAGSPGGYGNFGGSGSSGYDDPGSSDLSDGDTEEYDPGNDPAGAEDTGNQDDSSGDDPAGSDNSDDSDDDTESNDPV